MVEKTGIFLLGISAAAGLWSATNSSIFTISEFVKTEEDKEKALNAMNLGLGLCLLVAFGIYFTFGNLYAALGVIAFAAFMYWYYLNLMKDI